MKNDDTAAWHRLDTHASYESVSRENLKPQQPANTTATHLDWVLQAKTSIRRRAMRQENQTVFCFRKRRRFLVMLCVACRTARTRRRCSTSQPFVSRRHIGRRKRSVMRGVRADRRMNTNESVVKTTMRVKECTAKTQSSEHVRSRHFKPLI